MESRLSGNCLLIDKGHLRKEDELSFRDSKRESKSYDLGAPQITFANDDKSEWNNLAVDENHIVLISDDFEFPEIKIVIDKKMRKWNNVIFSHMNFNKRRLSSRVILADMLR